MVEQSVDVGLHGSASALPWHYLRTYPGRMPLVVTGLMVKAAAIPLAVKDAGRTVGRLTTDLRHRPIATVIATRWSYFVAHPPEVFANANAAAGSPAGGASASHRPAPRCAGRPSGCWTRSPRPTSRAGSRH